MDKLEKIVKETRKYNYSLCQFMHYYYYISRWHPNKQFMYPLEIEGDLEFNIVVQAQRNSKTIKLQDSLVEESHSNCTTTYTKLCKSPFVIRVSFGLKTIFFI